MKYCNIYLSKSDTHKVLGNRPNKKNEISTNVIQCSNYKLNYSNQQPIPNNFGDHYDIDDKSYWKDDYLNFDLANRQLTKRLKQYINLEKGPLAPDIDVGFGEMMNTLKNEGFITYGNEPSKPFYDFAIEKIK